MKIFKIAAKKTESKYLYPPEQFDHIVTNMRNTYSKTDGDRAIYQMVLDKFKARDTVSLDVIAKDVAETTLAMWQKMNKDSNGNCWYKVYERQACHDVLMLLKKSGFISDYGLFRGITWNSESPV